MSETIPESGSRTDIGRVRTHNEDSLAVTPPLYAIADGMGGHAAGEVASELAIESLVAHAPRNADAEALGRAVVAANRAVFKGVQEGLGKKGMGTTMTAAIIEDDRIALAQAGDSRAYLLHQGTLQQITRDHSLVNDLVEQGQITEAEARYHPNRSVITRALGSDLDMQPDTYTVEVGAGDRLLLCSDGLSTMLEDSQIQEILAAHPRPQEAADALVNAANEAGGHDNVTVIVVNLPSDLEEEAPTPRKSRRRRIVAVVLWTLAVAALIAGVLAGIRYYAYSSSYLIDDNGHVSLYRGLPNGVAGIDLSWPLSVDTTISVSDLPASQQQKLKDGWTQSTVEDGKNTLDYLRSEAEAAQQERSNAPVDTSSETSTGAEVW